MALENSCANGELTYIQSQGLVPCVTMVTDVSMVTDVTTFSLIVLIHVRVKDIHHVRALLSLLCFLFSYYRIGGDVCRGGVESSYVAMEMPCCNSDMGGSNATSVVLGCLVLVAVIVIVVFSVVMIVCFW